jgi:hypothetical protein
MRINNFDKPCKKGFAKIPEEDFLKGNLLIGFEFVITNPHNKLQYKA